MGFFRLSALLSARIDIDVEKMTGGQEQGTGEADGGDSGCDTALAPVGVSELKDHARLSALSEEGVNRDTDASLRGSSGTSNIQSNVGGDGSGGDAINPIHNDILNGGSVNGDSSASRSRSESESNMESSTTSKAHALSLEHVSGIDYTSTPSQRSVSVDAVSSGVKGHDSGGKSMKKRHTRVEYRPRAETASSFLPIQDTTADIHDIDEMELLTASTNEQNSVYVQLFFSLRLRTVKMIKYQIPLNQLLIPLYHLLPLRAQEKLLTCSWWQNPSQMFFSPYDSFFFMVKVVLAIQLVFMSRRTHTLEWIRVGEYNSCYALIYCPYI